MKRNYGIDLLRIVAMVFVAALHVIGIGGIITGSGLLSPQFLTAQFLRIAMLCAVNCYALISGYVGWDRRPKLSGFAMLWVKAVSVCVILTVLFARTVALDAKTIISALIPVTTGQYWYLTAYAGLFVLMPILNFTICRMPKKELTAALGGILLLFCLLPISPLTDAFYLHDGYSVLWLAVMYLLGGWLGKYEILSRLAGWKWGLLYLGAVVFAWLPRMVVLWWKPVYWSMAYGNILIEYTSPTIVLAAVSLLGVFCRLSLPRWAEGIVEKLSPHAFGVYLLHAHPLVFRYLLEDRFAHLGSGSIAQLVGTVLASALAICAAGMAADWLLTRSMKLLRIDRLLKRLDRSRAVIQPGRRGQ